MAAFVHKKSITRNVIVYPLLRSDLRHLLSVLIIEAPIMFGKIIVPALFLRGQWKYISYDGKLAVCRGPCCYSPSFPEDSASILETFISLHINLTKFRNRFQINHFLIKIIQPSKSFDKNLKERQF